MVVCSYVLMRQTSSGVSPFSLIMLSVPIGFNYFVLWNMRASTTLFT